MVGSRRIGRAARVVAGRWVGCRRVRQSGQRATGASARRRLAADPDPRLLQGPRGRAPEGGRRQEPRPRGRRLRDGPGRAGRADRGLRRAARRRHPGRAVRFERHRPAPRQAASAGIPVFTADIAARGGNVVSHVASDNVEGGRLAAQTLAERLGGKGEVIIIDHPEVASVQDRMRGFDEEIAKHPGIRVVGRPSASGQRARAMAVMEDMLQAHRDLSGVFGINDDSALGALAVLEAAGRKDVVIVGFDATPEAQEAIRRGSALKADVMQHPSEIGATAIDTIAGHLAKRPVDKVIAVPVSVVTARRSARSMPAMLCARRPHEVVRRRARAGRARLRARAPARSTRWSARTAPASPRSSRS